MEENLRLLGVEVVDQVLNVLLAEANAEPVVIEDDDVAHRRGLPPVEEGSASANAAERRDLELAEVVALAGDPADADLDLSRPHLSGFRYFPGWPLPRRHRRRQAQPIGVPATGAVGVGCRGER